MKKIAISGASGLIGKALSVRLSQLGYLVVPLVRNNTAKTQEQIYWDPQHGILDSNLLEGFDGIINLSGQNVAGGRWTDSYKCELKQSRIDSTKLLASTILKLSNPPKYFISASAIGYYGSRGDEALTEESRPGTGFFPEIALAWENEANRANRVTRVALLRTGVVLAKNGGALPQMLLPFKLFVGGKLGSGEQYLSWISIDDAVESIIFLINNNSCHGPYNIVSPHPIKNSDFTKVASKILKRPAFFTAPAFALKLALGEMADSLLLSSTRVLPQRLIDSGFIFKDADIESTIRKLCIN